MEMGWTWHSWKREWDYGSKNCSKNGRE